MAGETELGTLIGKNLNKNASVKEDLTGSSADLNFVVIPAIEYVDVEERTYRIKKENYVDGFILGHWLYGVLGSSRLGKTTTTDDYVVINTDNIFKEFVLNSDFIDPTALIYVSGLGTSVTSDATFDYTNQKITFTTGQGVVSRHIYYHPTLNIATVTPHLSTASIDPSNLEIYCSADGTHWELCFNNIEHTFSNIGKKLRYIIYAMGNSTINIKDSEGEQDYITFEYNISTTEPIPPTPPSTLLTGIRAYYKFDTNLNDSVNGYHGTNVGSTSVPAIINNGRNMNPGFISLPQNTLVNYPFTYNIWVYPNSFPGNASLISKRTGGPHSWDTVIDSTGSYMIRFYGQVWDSINTYYTGFFNTGSWQMVTVSLNGSTVADLKVYKNGVLQTPSFIWGASLTPPIQDTTTIRLGNDGALNFDGIYDELGVWDRALTQSEINTLYRSSAGLQYPFSIVPTPTLLTGLLAYWKLDETTGTTTIDNTGSFNGTVNTGVNINQTGKISKAYDFSQTGDNTVSFGNVPISTDMTYNFWMKKSVASVGEFIFSKYSGGYEDSLYILGGGGEVFTLYPGVDAFSFSYNSGVWTMVTLKKVGTNYSLYLDGVFKETIAHTPAAAVTTFFLGNQQPSAGFGYLGLLDEFGIWSRALTDLEISDLHNGGTGLSYPF